MESHIGFLRLATNMSDAVPAMMSSSAITNLHPELANSSTSLEMAALGRIRSQQRKATENGLVERNEKSSDASNSPESSGSSGPALPRVARTATGRSRTEDIQLVRTRSGSRGNTERHRNSTSIIDDQEGIDRDFNDDDEFRFGTSISSPNRLLKSLDRFLKTLDRSPVSTLMGKHQSASLTAVVMTIPSISRDFGISNLEAQWVTSAYALAFGW